MSAPRRSTAAKAPAVKAADVEAAPVEAARPFMSEGVRGDLAAYGRAIDPATGGVFERDEVAGKVTYTDRSGNVVDL